METHLLSIYIPTYNRRNCVYNQVKFFVNEMKGLEEYVEIVVSNNACTDDTHEAILSLIHNENFSYYCNDKNLGIVGNAYKSLDYTTGKYIWIVGDDDIFEHGVVKRVIDLLKHKKSINFLFLNYDTIYGKSLISPEGYTGEFGYINDVWNMINLDFYKRSIPMLFTSCIIHKRSTLKKTVQLLPLDNFLDYGWSYIAAFIAIKQGKGYFDSKIMLHDQNRGISWSDAVIASRNGCYKALDVLVAAGYSRKEVFIMKKKYIEEADTAELMIQELLMKSKNWKMSLKTLCNMFFINPLYIIRKLFS